MIISGTKGKNKTMESHQSLSQDRNQGITTLLPINWILQCALSHCGIGFQSERVSQLFYFLLLKTHLTGHVPIQHC